MNHRTRIFFFSLIAAGLGFAGGYLFSAKFCKVSIGKRVDKEIALSQELRTLFVKNTILAHLAARSPVAEQNAWNNFLKLIKLISAN